MYFGVYNSNFQLHHLKYTIGNFRVQRRSGKYREIGDRREMAQYNSRIREVLTQWEKGEQEHFLSPLCTYREIGDRREMAQYNSCIREVLTQWEKGEQEHLLSPPCREIGERREMA